MNKIKLWGAVIAGIIGLALWTPVILWAAGPHYLYGNPEQVLSGTFKVGNRGLTTAASTLVAGTATALAAGNSTNGSWISESKTSGGVFRLFDIHASQSATGNTSYAAPVNYPASSGYVLSSTTGGVMSWIAPTAGSGTVGGSGTAKRLTRWATGGTDIEDTAWDATGDVLTYDDSTQKFYIDPVPGTITIQQANGAGTYILLAGEYSDTAARFELTDEGDMGWGPGGGTSRDVTLARSSANNLTLGGGDTFNADHVFIDNAGDVKLDHQATIDTSTGVAEYYDLRAYATTGGTRVTVARIQNAALAPTLDFPTGATWNGNYIYHATGTDVPLTDGGTGASSAAAALTNLGAGPPYTSILVPFLPKVDNTQASSGVSDTTYAVYLGKCPKATTSFKVRCRTTTAYATGGAGPWAEIGIATGTPTETTNPVLTVIGSLDVSGTFNAVAGNKSATITATAAAGDDIWFLHGSKGTTPYVLRGCRNDELGGGGFATLTTSGAISGIAASTTFTINTSASPGYVQVFPQ